MDWSFLDDNASESVTEIDSLKGFSCWVLTGSNSSF